LEPTLSGRVVFQQYRSIIHKYKTKHFQNSTTLIGWTIEIVAQSLSKTRNK